MKRNELGNPVEYEEIYIDEGTCRSVRIEGDSPDRLEEEIAYLEEKEMISRDAQIILVPGKGALEQGERLCNLIKGVTKSHPLKLSVALYGFSQRSYARLHMTDFEVAIQALRDMAAAIRTSGIPCEIEICYLLYQFNMCEVRQAAAFAKEQDIRFVCRFASFEDKEKKRKYLALEMPVEDIICYSESYFFTYLDELESFGEEMFERFKAPRKIRIDKKGNVALDWYVKGQKERALLSFADKEELDVYYKENFKKASREPYTGKIWLWGECEKQSRNDLFRLP